MHATKALESSFTHTLQAKFHHHTTTPSRLPPQPLQSYSPSSVSSQLAVAVLRVRVTPTQFAGVVLVVLGLIATSVPQPIPARQSMLSSVIAALIGSLCLAASYPLSELVFRLTRVPPPVELVSAYGSLVGVVVFSTWTVVHTLPRWHEMIIEPIYTSARPSIRWAVAGYSLHALLVGAHTLAFFHCIKRLGTVPLAVSKGAQQAGSFLFSHIFFCSSDPNECFYTPRHSSSESGLGTRFAPMLRAWAHWQKTSAFVLCCVGVLVYALGKDAPSTVSSLSKHQRELI